jgi:hypothetical protein
MPDFNTPFVIAEAERGKFTPLTSNELTSLGQTVTGSRGRYAILTYQVGSTQLSGAQIGTSSPNSIETTVVNTLVSAVSTTTFTNADSMHYIELQNNGGSTVFVSHESVTYATLKTNGLTVAAGAFYSTNHAGDIWVGSETAGMDVRIVGHYSS